MPAPKATDSIALLRIKQLSYAYADQPVLHDVSFEVNTGEFVALLGPKGASALSQKRHFRKRTQKLPHVVMSLLGECLYSL